MAGWSQGGQSPRLETTLATMRQLHALQASEASATFDAQAARGRFASERARLGMDAEATSELALAQQVADWSIEVLTPMTYRLVHRHGDVHQDNVRYCDGRAGLIDWATKNEGDAMQELAYYAAHIDVDVDGFAAYAALYTPLDAAELRRAKAHLAPLHARNYVSTLRGMPWDAPERRLAKLRALVGRRRQDLAWLEQDG